MCLFIYILITSITWLLDDVFISDAVKDVQRVTLFPRAKFKVLNSRNKFVTQTFRCKEEVKWEVFVFQEDDEDGGYGEDTRIYLEKLEAVHKEFMQKSEDYEQIHKEYVQSEQVCDSTIALFWYSGLSKPTTVAWLYSYKTPSVDISYGLHYGSENAIALEMTTGNISWPQSYTHRKSLLIPEISSFVHQFRLFVTISNKTRK